jgi:hypothetical protein
MAQTIDSAPTQVTATATVPSSASPQFSGRINDVVALSQSGVDQTIVLSYIRTSPGPFQPSADEIIRLRDAGVSSQVITAMLQRSAELRDQSQALAMASAQNYAQPTTSYAQPAPTTVATPPATYVDPTYNPYYTEPSSSVVYIGGSYGSPYYYPYSYPYCYSGFYPSVGFYFGGRGYYHGGYYGGYRGGWGGHGSWGGGFHATGGGFHGSFGGGFHGGSVGFHGGRR